MALHPEMFVAKGSKTLILEYLQGIDGHRLSPPGCRSDRSLRCEQAKEEEVLLYHTLIVRLSPVRPTESSVHGWWIPRRQPQREPMNARTNNERMEATECVSKTS